MMSRTARGLFAVLMVAALAACEAQSTEGPTPTDTPTRTPAPNLSEHESGPESPIAYGLFVPDGATQLGPLFRYRSSRLIEAYTPELEVLQAERDAAIAEKIAEDEANGTPSPSPTPTPTSRPSADTFKMLGDPPRPDTSISLMRIDDEPSDVVRRMLAQIAAALPDADIDVNNLATHCTSKERRITGCHVDVSGETEGEREIHITMDVDPGRLSTRTSAPATMTRPVMQIMVEFIGDPREGQLLSETGSLDGVATIRPEDEVSGLIWPKMDEDAPLTTKLLDGWTTPPTASLILSGFSPGFAVIAAPNVIVADESAAEYVQERSKTDDITKDVTVDFNSVSTMYSSVTKDGGTARAVFILSARGNYTAFFYTPKPPGEK